jgi:crossover junction endodeoxyribonuclease RusA
MDKKVKHTVIIPLRPVPKERPRVMKGGYTYTPKRTLEFEKAIKEAWNGPTFESPVSVDITLYKEKIKVTITEEAEEKKSSLRGDIDNYTKSILDGLNGAAYKDDKLIVKTKVTKAQ